MISRVETRPMLNITISYKDAKSLWRELKDLKDNDNLSPILKELKESLNSSMDERNFIM